MALTFKRFDIALLWPCLAGRVGGTERVLVTLANALQSAGNKVTVLHWDECDGSPAFPLQEGVRRVNLFRPSLLENIYPYFRHVPYWRLRHFLQGWVPYSAFRRALSEWLGANRPRVVVGFGSGGAMVSVLAARRFRIPVIASLHLPPAVEFGSETPNAPKAVSDRARAALSAAAAIHIQQPEFADFFPPELRARCIVIPNAITPGITRLVSTVPRRPVVLGIGRLVHQKNFGDLVQAWAMIAADFPDWSVEIIGDGPLRADLEALSVGRGISARCRFRGWSEDLARDLAAASLVAQPSLYESFPLVTLEALACGVPVIGYDDCPGLNTIVSDGRNGLLVKRESGIAGFASALARLISDGPLRTRLAAAAPASVAQYSEDAFLARWLDLIERVVAGTRPPWDARSDKIGHGVGSSRTQPVAGGHTANHVGDPRQGSGSVASQRHRRCSRSVRAVSISIALQQGSVGLRPATVSI